MTQETFKEFFWTLCIGQMEASIPPPLKVVLYGMIRNDYF